MSFSKEFVYKDWILSYHTQLLLTAAKGKKLRADRFIPITEVSLPAIPVPIPVWLKWVKYEKQNNRIWSIYKNEYGPYELAEPTPYPLYTHDYYSIDLSTHLSMEMHLRKYSESEQTTWITSAYFDGKDIVSRKAVSDLGPEVIGGLYIGTKEEPAELFENPYSLIEQNQNLFGVYTTAAQ